MVVSSAFAQVEIEASKVTPTVPEPRIVTPPLLYETTRPPDADYYFPNVMVEHDPAFIEPFSSTYQTPTGSGRMRPGGLDLAESSGGVDRSAASAAQLGRARVRVLGHVGRSARAQTSSPLG